MRTNFPNKYIQEITDLYLALKPGEQIWANMSCYRTGSPESGVKPNSTHPTWVESDQEDMGWQEHGVFQTE